MHQRSKRNADSVDARIGIQLTFQRPLNDVGYTRHRALTDLSLISKRVAAAEATSNELLSLAETDRLDLFLQDVIIIGTNDRRNRRVAI